MIQMISFGKNRTKLPHYEGLLFWKSLYLDNKFQHVTRIPKGEMILKFSTFLSDLQLNLAKLFP
jgi:hypothetical protein